MLVLGLQEGGVGLCVFGFVDTDADADAENGSFV